MPNRSNTNVQHKFFLLLKDRSPSHLSFVDELADILKLSIDSVYRRMRGEKQLLFEEIYTLCDHYRVSFDDFFHLSSDTVTFHCPFKTSPDFSTNAWLKNLDQQIRKISSNANNEIQLVINDLSNFHYFQNRTITTFKLFFWNYYLLPHRQTEKFSIKKHKHEFEEQIQTAMQIGKEFTRVRSYEIWNRNVFNRLEYEIKLVHDCGGMEKEDFNQLIDGVYSLIDRFENWAERGFKNPAGRNGEKVPFEFCLNNTEINNHIIAKCNSEIIGFLQYNDFWGWLTTTDLDFVNAIMNEMNTIRKTIVSDTDTGDKLNKEYFGLLRKRFSTAPELIS